MAITMKLDIVSAEQEIFSDLSEMVLVPGTDGDLGIMPQHTQLISTLKAGEVKVTLQGGEQQSIFISGGIIEVQPHVVTILSDTAIRADELDEERAQKAKEMAESMLGEHAADEVSIAQAQAELIQAIEQLKMIESMKKKRGM
jgi:F-type H+-transporting ATPase subunit epsilon